MSLTEGPGVWGLLVYTVGALVTLVWLFWKAVAPIVDGSQQSYARDLGMVLLIIGVAGAFWPLVWLIVAVDRRTHKNSSGAP